MTQKQVSDVNLADARIGDGFSFALAAFAVGLALVAVLQRVGLPDRALQFCVGGMIFVGFMVIAGVLRTMRPAEFYAGGRSLPAAYAGLAYAGLAAALFLPFLPPLPRDIGLVSLIAGFGGGLVCATFFIGPYLRRAAVFSITDLAAARFPHPVTRWTIGLLAAACAALVALAGFAVALRAFVSVTGASQGFGAAILGVLLICLVVPGGLSGVLWIAAGGAVVTVMALGLPPALSMLRESTLWSAGIARFDVVTGAHAPAFDPVVFIAVMLGLAALIPLFGPAVSSRDRASALRAAPFAFMFTALIAALMALTFARSTLALDAAIVGRAPAALPASILSASAQGNVTICGVQSGIAAVLSAACADQPGSHGIVRMEAVGARASFLLDSLPMLRQAGATLGGLAAVFSIALGIGLAAAGAQAFATSLGHDILHPRRRRFGPASRRLAHARGLVILLVAICGAYLVAKPTDARVFAAFALAISASSIAPVLGLTLVERATSFDALMALVTAGAVMGHFLVSHMPDVPPSGMAAYAIFAAFDGFLVGVVLSFVRGRSGMTPPRAVLPAPSDEFLGPD